jgi:type I restriction enzyme S subunit
MSGTVRLEQLIEKSHIKCRDFDGGRDMEAFGVSNTDGITRTAHRKSDDLGDYLVIEPGSFAYNPYRINVGSIGLAPEGLTGVVSPAYIVFRTKDKLIPEVLLDFLKSAEGLRQINKLASGAVRKALRFEDLCEIEFPALSHGRQLEILKHKKSFNQQHRRLLTEITHQEALLAKLKQAILQEAIQGKLTAEWRAANPDVEPASQLLQRIQAEKARLITSKKLRSEKPLPKITPAEIPFEIPKGWEWCRLGEINMKFMGGEAYQSGSILPSGTNQVVRIGNIKPDTLELSKRPAFISDSLAEETSGSRLQPGDILVTMTGTYQKKDYCYTVLLTDEHFADRRLYQNQRVGCFRLHPEIHKPFFIRALKLVPLLDPVFESSTGAANQANISKGALLNILIPLPPLAEQAAIVERVEALMTICRALEEEIEHTRTHASHLLQAVLKEAFAPATTNG